VINSFSFSAFFPAACFSYGLLGPSGCGKTTLLRCVIGRLKVDDGVVLTLGKRPGSVGHRVPGNQVGYMPQVLEDVFWLCHMFIERIRIRIRESPPFFCLFFSVMLIFHPLMLAFYENIPFFFVVSATNTCLKNRYVLYRRPSWITRTHPVIVADLLLTASCWWWRASTLRAQS
jgi:energy-coupling factor transporter ATP-binding protein EcfA2